MKVVSDWAQVEPMGVSLANITSSGFFIQRWGLLALILLSYPRTNISNTDLRILVKNENVKQTNKETKGFLAEPTNQMLLIG